MNPSTGVISGTPTAASGSTNLTFQVTDSTSPSQTNSAVLSLAVDGSGSPTTVYSYSIAYDAVGNVTAYNDSVNGFWTMMTSDGISGYDWLNQLEAAQAISGPYAGLQVNWDYDSFGNRTEENFTGSYSGTAGIPPSTNVSYNGNNQVTSVNGGSGFSYDATGDVTQDSENQYLYDADGRVCAAYDMLTHIMTGYLYDAEGNRIAKGAISSFSCDTTQNGFTPTALYILSPSGQQLTEMTWSGGTAQWSHTNVWAAGAGLIATYSPDSSGQTAGILNFELNDWLGTRRVLTKSDGTIQQTCESLPYGNGGTCAPTPTEHLYTQHERDAETNNDYFGARYYSSNAGRFLTPDWAAHVEPVPYAKLGDPQSLNLYSYVQNNPLAKSDADGHCEWCREVWNAAVAIKNSAYIKVEVGMGVEVQAKGLLAGVQVGAKSVRETDARFENRGTVKYVNEASAKIKVAGKLSIGPSISQEQTVQRGNGPENLDAPKEVHGNFLYDIGDYAGGSNSDVGVGIGAFVGIGGSVEVGVDAKELIQGVATALSSQPTKPASPDDQQKQRQELQDEMNQQKMP